MMYSEQELRREQYSAGQLNLLKRVALVLDSPLKSRCCFCGVTIKEYVYQCIICEQLLSCEICFDFGRQSGLHLPNHPMLFHKKIGRGAQLQKSRREVSESCGLKTVHKGISCKVCQNGSDITGYRVKCEQCIDFDMCWICYEKGLHVQQHRLVIYIDEVNWQLDFSQFQIIGKLGEGAFGKVQKAKHKVTDEIVAVKTLKPIGTGVKSFFQNQVKAVKEFRSSCLVFCRGYGHSQRGMHIFMDWIDGDTLLQVIKDGRASFRRRTSYATDIIRALIKLHIKKFVHKDVKPDNVLIDGKGRAKLCDLGVASPYEIQDRVAPQHWSAPQLLLNRRYSTSTDIFSFGLLLNFLFTQSDHQLTGQGPKLISRSPHFITVIAACTSKKPEDRPSAAQLYMYFSGFKNRYWLAFKKKGVDKQQYIKMNDEIKNQVFKQLSPKINQRVHYLLRDNQRTLITWFCSLDFSWKIKKGQTDAVKVTFLNLP